MTWQAVPPVLIAESTYFVLDVLRTTPTIPKHKLIFVLSTKKGSIAMPYEPSRGVYRYIDEQIAFRQPNQPGAPRAAQVLPRRNYDPVELARAVRHQARLEAKQKNRLPTSRATRAAPDEEYEEYDDADIDGNGDDWPPPLPTVTRTYQVDNNGVPRRQTRIDHYHQTPFISPRQPADQPRAAEPRYRRRVQVHWLVFVGVGLLLMIGGWIAFNDLGNWWQMHQDDVAYGNPRTFQIDAVVGHFDNSTSPSHFTAENLKGQIIVVEFPGGDISKARSYNITIIPGNVGNPPVRLAFQDINHDGKLDMVILIGDPGDTITIFLFNNGTQFVSKL